MSKAVIVTPSEKRIILMGIFDIGVMLARISGRLQSVNKMDDEEGEAVRDNLLNIQSLIASILESSSDDISEAMNMSKLIDNDLANVVDKVSRKLLDKDNDNDDGIDLDGLKDLLNL